MREYYNLEEVWGGKKVNIKLNSEKTAQEASATTTKRPRIVRGKTVKLVD
jgi:hypothetical protein